MRRPWPALGRNVTGGGGGGGGGRGGGGRRERREREREVYLLTHLRHWIYIYIVLPYISQHSTNPSAVPVKPRLKTLSRLYAPAVKQYKSKSPLMHAVTLVTTTLSYSDYYLPDKAVVPKSVNI